MKNLTDFLRKTVETSVDPRLQCSSLPHVLSQRPKLTGSGLFAIFGQWFLPIFWASRLYKSIDTKYIWQREDILKGKTPYFRLTCVTQKRLCLNFLT